MKKYLVEMILTVVLLILDIVILLIFLNTQKQELMYLLGLCTGLFFAVFIICLISIFVQRKRICHGHFDERQLKSRGDCFCVSFFFLLICLFMDGGIRNITNYSWSSYFVGIFTWSMLSVGVFAIMAIWKDAYISIGENKIRFCIFLGIIGILNLTIGIVNAIRNSFIIDGKVDTSFINLLGGFILLVVAVNLIIKNKIDKRKVLIEDEEFETEVC